MRKQIIENAAFEVATQVRAVEDTIDNAIAEIAELQAKMVRARSATGTGVATGQVAFEKLADAVQSLIAARGGMALCHAELAVAKTKIPGLRTTSWGDGEECPPAEGALPSLRIVA